MVLVSRLSRFLTRNIRSTLRASVRHYDPETGGEDLKSTTVTFLNKQEDDFLYVEAYSEIGFRLSNGFRIIGPAVLFPRSILHWGISSTNDISEKSLSLFTLLEPKLDLLIIGIGDYGTKYDKNIIRYLRNHKINVEILPTSQACSTFNFLNAERRIVAAAMVPPKYVDVVQDEDLVYRAQLESSKDPFDISFDNDPLKDKPGELDSVFEDVQKHIYPKLGIKMEKAGKEGKKDGERGEKKDDEEKR